MRDPEERNQRMVDALMGSMEMSPTIESAFRTTPRHEFLPGESLDAVYSGDAIPLKRGSDGLAISASSEPAIMATMLTQLDVRRGSRVLEIGTGSGYNAAILASLVGEPGSVTTIDIEADLVSAAARRLADAGGVPVRSVVGDGWEGFAEGGPYDCIESTVGAWDVSPRWVDQLTEDGILVVPLWLRAGVQCSVAFRRVGSTLTSVSVRPCGFMRLRGPHAGPESYARIDGWVACVEDDGASVDAVRELLAGPVRSSAAPALVDGWFLDLALREPLAVQMWTIEEPWAERQGIVLPDGTGMALIEGTELLSFGAAEAAERLRSLVRDTLPVRLEELHLEAVPSSATSDAGPGTLLVRPNYTYALTVRPPAGPNGDRPAGR